MTNVSAQDIHKLVSMMIHNRRDGRKEDHVLVGKGSETMAVWAPDLETALLEARKRIDEEEQVKPRWPEQQFLACFSHVDGEFVSIYRRDLEDGDIYIRCQIIPADRVVLTLEEAHAISVALEKADFHPYGYARKHIDAAIARAEKEGER